MKDVVSQIDAALAIISSEGWRHVTPSVCLYALKKNDYFLRKYDVAWKDYCRMVERQENRCAICRDRFGDAERYVDHCHRAGKVRGLLCHKCNVGIGMFMDSVTRLENAIAYLQSC